jgi:hypothetical protein
VGLRVRAKGWVQEVSNTFEEWGWRRGFEREESESIWKGFSARGGVGKVGGRSKV